MSIQINASKLEGVGGMCVRSKYTPRSAKPKLTWCLIQLQTTNVSDFYKLEYGDATLSPELLRKGRAQRRKPKQWPTVSRTRTRDLRQVKSCFNQRCSWRLEPSGSCPTSLLRCHCSDNMTNDSAVPWTNSDPAVKQQWSSDQLFSHLQGRQRQNKFDNLFLSL